MKPLPKLNAQQKRFCQEYVIDGIGTAAAKRAGYSERSACSQATRLLTLPHIHKQLEKERAKIAKRNNVTIDEITGMHREAFQVGKEEGQASGMTASAQNLAKLHGLIVDKSEVSTDITIEVVRYALETDTKTIEKPKNVIEHTGVDTKTITFEAQESESI